MTSRLAANMRRVGIVVTGLVFILSAFASSGALAFSTDDTDSVLNNYPWYDTKCPGGGQASQSSAGSGGVTINSSSGAAAQKVAVAAHNADSSTQVSFAVYSSSANTATSTSVTGASYQANSETYGASVTKSILLLAYLQTLGTKPLSSTAQSDLTGMIEQSNDADSNAVYNLLAQMTNPTTAINKAANGMPGFTLNTTGDSLYYLGQSLVTADGLAKFFSTIKYQIDHTSQGPLGEQLLSTITPQAGLLQAGLPGTVYSKEGWKPEPGGGSDPARSGSANPYGSKGAPYVVNQAGSFTSGTTTYGIAVTVAGTTNEAAGETIIKNVVAALISQNDAADATGQCCPTGSGGASTGSSVSISNAQGEELIFKYFVANGFSAIQAAAIVGNFQQESSLSPTALNNIGAYGLAQWLGPRLTAMRSFVSGKGGNPATLGGQTGKVGQLDFVMEELKTDFNNVLKEMKSAKTLQEAVHDWNFDYEKSGAGDAPRLAFANTALNDAHKGGWANNITSSVNSTDTSASCASSNAGTSGNCSSATGRAKILACAKLWTGLYYRYGGGHQYSYSQFTKICPDPSKPPASPANAPHGAPPLDGGQSGNPNPCAVDCSSLVSFAVDMAFKQSFMWNVGAIETGGQWTAISKSSVQAGDVVTIGANEHVEIVDNYNKSTGKLTTMGAHDTGSKDGEVGSGLGDWTGAYRYKGPGV